MRLIRSHFSRILSMLLVCALVAVSAIPAQAKTLTAETVHARLAKRGLGNWVGVELNNGTAFAGRIVSMDDNSFGLQLHNDPTVTPVLYSDVVKLHTGVSNKAFWVILIAGFGGSAAVAAIGVHELHQNERSLQLPPVSQPIFP